MTTGRIIYSSLFAGLAIYFTGCVVPQVAQQPRTLESEIADDRLAFLHSGQATKAEVIKELDKTPWTFENDSKWVYPMRTYRTRRWEFCFVAPGGDFDCDLKTTGNIKYQLLVIDYDSVDVVTNWNVFSTEANSCIENGICLHAEGIFVQAPEIADSLAKQFDVPDYSCAIYLYATLPEELNVLSVSMDNDLVGYLGGSDSFLHWIAELGPHAISALPADSWVGSGEDTEILELDCKAGDILILHKDRSNRQHRPPVLIPYIPDGQKAIRDRNLLLSSGN